jgi:hypothetical protein
MNLGSPDDDLFHLFPLKRINSKAPLCKDINETMLAFSPFLWL